MKQILAVSFILSVLGLAGCGSVSGIKPTSPHTTAELAAYDKIIVANFDNGTKCKEPEKVQIAGKTFADSTAIQIQTAKLFTEVSREQTPGKAIVIGGTITRYAEGNSTMRLLIGCGAGSSYFDVDVIFKDNETGEQIATLKVDKNSWGLGGGIASAQTVEVFMDEGTKKIVKELDAIKNPKQK